VVVVVVAAATAAGLEKGGADEGVRDAAVKVLAAVAGPGCAPALRCGARAAARGRAGGGDWHEYDSDMGYSDQ
jgi:hypothetical protein